METLNSNPNETKSVPASDPIPAASIPEAAAAPVVTPAPAAPAVTTAPAAAPAVKGELPKTNGNTPGGWNRFAGYDPKAAKNKPGDRGSKGRR